MNYSSPLLCHPHRSDFARADIAVNVSTATHLPGTAISPPSANRRPSLLRIVTPAMKIVTVRNSFGKLAWCHSMTARLERAAQAGSAACSSACSRRRCGPPATRTDSGDSTGTPANIVQHDSAASTVSGNRPAAPGAQNLSHLSIIVVLASQGEHFSVRLKFTAADKKLTRR